MTSNFLTVHAATASQNVLDGPHLKKRTHRSIFNNIIPNYFSNLDGLYPHGIIICLVNVTVLKVENGKIDVIMGRRNRVASDGECDVLTKFVEGIY